MGSEKIAETIIKDGKAVPKVLTAPRGVDPERFQQMRHQRALMNATLTPGGSATVDCPYCILYTRKKVPVDVTKFVDQDGKKEYHATCLYGHDLRFRQVDDWREERQKAGLQSR